MDATLLIAFSMVALAAILVFLSSKNLSAESEQRMTRMMKLKGLDPETAQLDDPRVTEIIQEVRARCRKCQREDLCERWLKGEVEGENTFCPNARVFTQLTRNVERAA